VSTIICCVKFKTLMKCERSVNLYIIQLLDQIRNCTGQNCGYLKKTADGAQKTRYLNLKLIDSNFVNFISQPYRYNIYTRNQSDGDCAYKYINVKKHILYFLCMIILLFTTTTTTTASINAIMRIIIIIRVDIIIIYANTWLFYNKGSNDTLIKKIVLHAMYLLFKRI